jgi:hypothetical protein
MIKGNYMRFVFAVVASAVVLSGCGDVIKMKNPFVRSKPHNPELIRDPVSGLVCGNFMGQYRGTCESDGVVTESIRNVDQASCGFFQVVDGGTFYLNKDFSDLHETLPSTTNAAFVDGSNFRTIKLTETWEDSGVEFRQESTIDSINRTFITKLVKDDLETHVVNCVLAK